MGKRGPKPRRFVRTKWDSELAYAVGLIATDGCLSKDKRHVDFTSKESEQIKNFVKALRISHIKIGKKSSGKGERRKYLRVQIGDVNFYSWLCSIGLTERKSKTIGVLRIPKRYFFDFLRGVFDGDGSSYSYRDPRWPGSFMFYLSFASASQKFLDWIRTEIYNRLKVHGHITHQKDRLCHQLKYAKKDSLKIIRKVYYCMMLSQFIVGFLK